MILNNIENIKKYVAYLRMHREEQQALFNDMLISVTDFFREPNTFLALKEKVFPELVEKKQSNQTIRVWIPGCSTGEEVYSIAMALTEFMEEKGLAFPILIFGTDVNGKNIEKARRGIYLKTIENSGLPRSVETLLHQLKRKLSSNQADSRQMRFRKT